jgi:hypothetical protein
VAGADAFPELAIETHWAAANEGNDPMYTLLKAAYLRAITDIE